MTGTPQRFDKPAARRLNAADSQDRLAAQNGTSRTMSNAFDPRPAQKIDSFGCSLKTLDCDQRIQGASIDFFRKHSRAGSPGHVTMPESGRGFLVGLSAAGGHRRRIFKGPGSSVHDFAENTVYVRDLSDPYAAYLEGSFDFILLEISKTTLSQLADGSGTAAMTRLCETAGQHDPVLAGLSKALFSSLAPDRQPSALFVDQMSVAIGVHLIRQYGDGRETGSDRRRTLSRRAEIRAKELLRSRPRADISMADIAAQCNLSPSAFLRAFRETAGVTPHQWLMQQRLDQARTLLLNSALSISEISAACGFADQAHFTRAFSASIGTPPATWRRTMRS